MQSNTLYGSKQLSDSVLVFTAEIEFALDSSIPKKTIPDKINAGSSVPSNSSQSLSVNPWDFSILTIGVDKAANSCLICSSLILLSEPLVVGDSVRVIILGSTSTSCSFKATSELTTSSELD